MPGSSAAGASDSVAWVGGAVLTILPMPIQRPAVFMDRDGTLNEMVYDADHGVMDSPLMPEQIMLRRQASSFVAALNELGYLCIVVTNQPGVAKGTLTLERLARIHDKLEDDLRRNGASIEKIYFCPHHPDAGTPERKELAIECACRKPAPGLLIEAAAEYRIDLPRSFMVGDGLVDVEAGRRAGVSTILVTQAQAAMLEMVQQRPEARPDRLASDLNAALSIIAGRRAEEREVAG